MPGVANRRFTCLSFLWITSSYTLLYRESNLNRYRRYTQSTGNGFIESYNGKMRDNMLIQEVFDTNFETKCLWSAAG